MLKKEVRFMRLVMWSFSWSDLASSVEWKGFHVGPLSEQTPCRT